MTELGYYILAAQQHGYSLWQCDDGTYDVVDPDGEICACNLGIPDNEGAAWADYRELDPALHG